MMAPSHAIMGATAGVVISSIFNYDLRLTLLMTLVCAGAALLPDCDQPSSTFGHSIGFITKWISKGMYWTSSTIYIGTKTSFDTAAKSGHRKITHTIVFNLILGSLLFLAFYSPPIQWFVIGFMVTLGIRGMLAEGLNVYFPIDLNGKKKSKRILKVEQGLAFFTGVVISFVLYAQQITFSPWHLAPVITVGCLIHLVGDCCTPMGVPLLWPIPIARQMWFKFRLPWTFDAGKKTEKNIITPFLFAVFLIVSFYTLM